MRIALVTHQVNLHDGQGRVNYELARAILAHGHHLTIIAEYCADEIAQHPSARFICARFPARRKLPTQLLRNLDFANRSARWLRAHRSEFDIVQANGFVTWQPADLVAVHFVHTAWLHNPFFPFRWSSFSPYAWYQRGLAILSARQERRAFRSARLLAAVSESTADELAALGLPPHRIRIVHNGVDVAEFHPGPAERPSFGLPPDVPLALFAGDIRTPRKNLDTLLQALVALPGVHLAVAGKPEGSPYPQLARELGLAERVHFLGLTQRMPALMRSVDVFVMPSRYESYGMVVVEAMASGLPAVLTASVGVARAVASAAIILPNPDDADTLSQALRSVLESPARAAEMKALGRTLALHMQWSDTAAGYLRLYEELYAQLQAERHAQGSAGVVA